MRSRHVGRGGLGLLVDAPEVPSLRALRAATLAVLACFVVVSPAAGQGHIPDASLPAFQLTWLDSVPDAMVADVGPDSEFHLLWGYDDEALYYLTRTRLVPGVPVHLNAEQHTVSTDPAMFVDEHGTPRLAWSVLRAPSSVRPEWDILYVNSPVFGPGTNYVTFDSESHPDEKPAIAAAGDSVCIVWVRDGTEVWYSLFTPPVADLPQRKRMLVAIPEVEILTPQIIPSPAGGFLATWTVETPDGDGDLWFARISSADSATASPVREGPADDRYPSLAADVEGRAMLVWQEGQPAGILNYSLGRLGGGLNPPVRLLAPGRTCRRPNVARGDDGTTWIAWQEAESSEIRLATLFEGGLALEDIFVIESYDADLTLTRSWLRATPGTGPTAIFQAAGQNGGNSNAWAAVAPAERPAPAFLSLSGVTQFPEGVMLRWRCETPENVEQFEILNDSGHGERGIASIIALPDRKEYSYFHTGVPTHAIGYAIHARGTNGEILGRVVATATPASLPTLSVHARPNPFNGRISLNVGLPRNGYLTIRVFDVRGVHVADLAHSSFEPGVHAILWDGRGEQGDVVGAGVYFIRCAFRAGERIETVIRRVTLVP